MRGSDLPYLIIMDNRIVQPDDRLEDDDNKEIVLRPFGGGG
jgi:hypothetical protein